ncbi:MAG: right-handed parallel beta-helix repeat-containing protein [Bacteroidia bacterium]|nr:right-handed parallel beta-helix repeat-containing protein [Bacteroidia bacterium]
MARYIFIVFAVFYISFTITLSSCHNDIISDAPEIPLSFSLDTLRFDTVFTEAGSATRSFKIYNELEEAVILNEIMLESNQGFFRLNIDGIPSNAQNDVRIEGKDSIYVFAEVTIDPDLPLSISPFIIEDKVLIKANNSSYKVNLEAWGQNANYFPGRDAAGRVNYVSCDLQEWRWDDPRPYVIYGALIVDSCRLVIPEGQSVYVHGGIAINELGIYNDGLILFLQNASLQTEGTAENPVIFRSDRLEEEFQETPGQWAGIILNAGSDNNMLKHTKIMHSIVGISVDSTSSLRMEQCEIAYTSGNGIAASHASVYAQNCLFYSNLSSAASLNFGGSYIFNYCTFVNTDNQDNAISMNNLKCTDPLCQGEILVNPLYAEFNNCIIAGNDDDEIGLLDATDDSNPAFFSYNFNNCIVAVNELLDPDAFPNFFDNCNDCINYDTPDSLFIDLDFYDLHLDTMSIAIDKAMPIIPIISDLEGNPRESNLPDIGCYEFQK